MSERDGRISRNDLPSTTAQFRATPDASASTAQFKAFAAGQGVGASRAPRAGADAWPEQPWAGEAPAQGSSRTAAIVVGAIVVVALVVTLIVLLG
jgi:hypothetical protein